ncbi:MAG: serine/threonine-protein kinase [bacterium]
MSDATRIARLLESVSDGAAIDWEQEESAALGEREKALLSSLRSISAIGTLAANPVGALAQPGEWVGHLRIDELLGSGAYGDVFRAWDSHLEREVALKLLAPEEPLPWRAKNAAAAPSYIEEARRLAGVRHTNVVNVFSVERFGKGGASARPGIVMEMIRGRTLAEIVRRDGRFGANEIAAIGIELCRALSAVHLSGIVHRDVKAQNVMREDGGRIVLMDFGPGRGTPLYMAPEVMRGDAPSARSDLYSLGVLLYFLAAADYPVRGASMDDLRQAHAARATSPLRDVRPDLPAALVQTIEAGLAADPDARYASAGALERALAATVVEGRAAGAATEPARADAPAAAASAARNTNAGASAKVRATRSFPDATRASASRIRFAIIAFCAGLVLMIAAASYFASRPGRDAARTGAATTAALTPAGSVATGAFTVSASAHRGASQRERLGNGARVAPGDSISIAITASESLYVYVINEDERGDAFLLFPSDEYVPRNPLPSGIDHRLPGSRRGRHAYWEITSAGGREHLLLVASRARLVSFENAALGLTRPARDGAAPALAPIANDAMLELRGMGGFVEEDGSATARALSKSLFEMAEPLRAESETVRGIWIRKLTFENPPS